MASKAESKQTDDPDDELLASGLPSALLCCCRCLPPGLARRNAWPLTIITIFLSLNLFLNYYNKFVLGDKEGDLNIGIPVFYSFFHQLVGFLCWSTVLVAKPAWNTLRRDIFAANWHWLYLNAFFFSTAIAAQNAALVKISLSVSAVLKSMVPIPIMILSYLIEKKRYSLAICATMAVQLAGAILTVLDTSDESVTASQSELALGYGLILYSVIATGFRPVITSKIFANGGGPKETGLSPLIVAWYDSLGASLTLLPFALGFEYGKLVDAFAHAGGRSGAEVMGWTAIGSFAASSYNFSMFAMVSATSTLTYTVVGIFKQVVLIGGAGLVVDHVSSPMIWAGIIVFLVGSVAYAYVRHIEDEAAKAKAASAATEETPLKGAGRRP